MVWKCWEYWVYFEENLLNWVKICAQVVHGGTNDNLNAWPPWSCILFTQSPIPCHYRSKPEKCNSRNKIRCKLFQMFWTRPSFICQVSPFSRDYTTLKSERKNNYSTVGLNFECCGWGTINRALVWSLFTFVKNQESDLKALLLGAIVLIGMKYEL